MKVLLACACGSAGNYAQTQFKIKNPKEKVPSIYIGRKGYNFLETLTPGTEVYSFVSAILKKKGRYSYLIEWDEDGKLVYVWNYQTNRRVP